MATKLLTKGRKRIAQGPRLEPLARNAFRVLGLSASASQGEIYERATALRLAHELGVEKSFGGDLAWLGTLSRAEADVRDALGRLADPPQRIAERLFWFHTVPEIEPPATTAQLWEAVGSLLRAETPSARHDAALLALAALARLDPAFEERGAWARVYSLWRDVLEGEEFWSLLVASDLRGEFEQLANHGEAGALRARTPRLLTAHVAERARQAVARDDFETAARALGVLRAASLPGALLGEYENAALGPVEDRAEAVCDESFGVTPLFYTGDDPTVKRKRYFDQAWKNFHWRVKPHLARFLLLAGPRSHALRRSCERAAESLNGLADAYGRYGFPKQGRHVYRQARNLAPPGSAALLSAEEGLRALDPAASALAYDEPAYAAALAAELADMSVPKGLFDDDEPLAPPPVGDGETLLGCLGQMVFYALVVGGCLLLNECGVINTRRPRPALPTMNFNYNAPRIVIPPMLEYPPVNIPPLRTPTPPKKTRRRQRPAGGQTNVNDSTTDAPPIPPPTTTTRAPPAVRARPSPGATPKN